MTDASPANDPINPAHYRSGGMQCIDAIEALGIGPEFCRATAIKYLWRLGNKDDELQDARKALWYVNRLVQELEQTNLQRKEGE